MEKFHVLRGKRQAGSLSPFPQIVMRGDLSNRLVRFPRVARAVRAGAGFLVEESADGDADEFGEQAELGGEWEALLFFPAAPGGLGDAEISGDFLERHALPGAPLAQAGGEVGVVAIRGGVLRVIGRHGGESGRMVEGGGGNWGSLTSPPPLTV